MINSKLLEEKFDLAVARAEIAETNDTTSLKTWTRRGAGIVLAGMVSLGADFNSGTARADEAQPAMNVNPGTKEAAAEDLSADDLLTAEIASLRAEIEALKKENADLDLTIAKLQEIKKILGIE